ncbi:response regulator [Effusibacillus consociatus]|uniref:Transcriptional regulatory protein n=1 Tax=Effusibacillus consociatus TaxID=1117041 RepID=A0ABV9Q1J9_9BACL
MQDKIRVLIVEDDFRVAGLHKEFVESVSPFSIVAIAGTGQEALEKISQMPIDLVLLDIYLPDMSGMELLRQIRKERIPVDAIVISASKEAEMVQEAVRNGVLDIIIKPANLDRFRQALETYKEFSRKIPMSTEVTQEQVDQLYRTVGNRIGTQHTDLPKGIDRKTLLRIESFLKSSGKSVTAEEVGKELGVSRTTARRYLEFMVETNQIECDLIYGTVGRPEKVFRSL